MILNQEVTNILHQEITVDILNQEVTEADILHQETQEDIPNQEVIVAVIPHQEIQVVPLVVVLSEVAEALSVVAAVVPAAAAEEDKISIS